MRKDTVFFRQAELVLRVLPLVNQEEVFALKGGTAINFFLQTDNYFQKKGEQDKANYLCRSKRGRGLRELQGKENDENANEY